MSSQTVHPKPEPGEEGLIAPKKKALSKGAIIGIVVAVVVVLGIALGVGLGVGLKKSPAPSPSGTTILIRYSFSTDYPSLLPVGSAAYNTFASSVLTAAAANAGVSSSNVYTVSIQPGSTVDTVGVYFAPGTDLSQAYQNVSNAANAGCTGLPSGCTGVALATPAPPPVYPPPYPPPYPPSYPPPYPPPSPPPYPSPPSPPPYPPPYPSPPTTGRKLMSALDEVDW